MKITSFKSTEHEETITFNKNVLLTSSDNTEGKTTIVRSIIFGLGFDVTVISDGFDNLKPKITIGVEHDNKSFILERTLGKDKKIIYVFTREKVLQKTYNLEIKIEADLYAKFLGFEDYEFMNKMIGVIFIDQDFGWRTINHGRVHPNKDLRFDFPQLFYKLINIDSTNISDLLHQRDSLKKELKSFESISTLWPEKETDVDFATNEIAKDINELTIMKKNLEQKIQSKEKYDKDFLNFILFIKKNDAISSFIKEKDIDLIKELSRYESRLNEEEINNLNIELKKVNEVIEMKKNKLLDRQTIFNDAEYEVDKFKEFFELAANISNVSKQGLNFSIDIKRERIEKLNREINTALATLREKASDEFKKMESNIKVASGTEINISLETFFNFTQSSEFDKLSGAKKGILVLLTRKIIMNLFANKTNIDLPIIIDTLGTMDPSDNTIKIIKEIIESFSLKNQVILVGVNEKINDEMKKIDGFDEIIIEAKFKTSTNQLSLDL